MDVASQWENPLLMESRWMSTKAHFPFIVSFSEFTWSHEFEHWLLNIGKNHKDWEWWYDGFSKSYKFEFKNEEDKVKFILRWS